MFPNGQSQLVFDCVNGEYVAAAGEFMDCEPECKPQCQNGGECIGINICKCPQEFRGAYCQYGKNSPHWKPDRQFSLESEKCDPSKLNFNGGVTCNGGVDEVECNLYCPDGIHFSFQPEEKYTCSYESGEFLPTNVPQCLLAKNEKIVVQSHSYITSYQTTRLSLSPSEWSIIKHGCNKNIESNLVSNICFRDKLKIH